MNTRVTRHIAALSLFVATTCVGCSIGSFGCPSMSTGIDTFDNCPDGQVKVCETTEEGRCCTCDTPRSTAPAADEEY
ncbi:hypothetical protein FIV42_27845 [Persicimonas caeni]|uniref:Lipoprotein n=1 Tax=Persicimonas caeni TaxID=2292766 RepID=A0A4Y6Q1T5_PERCE|nr:hypothetical protein [Persicimonas caeni]QDG54419.1 hypothetical protein FIV42_27845 [Persicimonas caeni]QED35640.1 hypothetical protein FRD00_27840 [Persicimonas caeni]